MPQLLRFILVILVLVTGLALAYPFRKISASSNVEPEKTETEVLVLRTDCDPGSSEPGEARKRPVRDTVRILDIVPSQGVISQTNARSGFSADAETEVVGTQEFDDKSSRSLPSIQESSQRLPTITKFNQQEEMRRRQEQARAQKPARPRRAKKKSEETKSIVRYTMHRIVDGDELRNLAASYLNSPDRHLEIFELNRDVIRHPDVLPLHTEIKIPVE